MKTFSVTAALLSLFVLPACVGLEYPSYWSFDDSFLINLITLPFEIVMTPVIFVLKLAPIL